ncbi:hypothetical protein BS17DRAFT_763816 [Gyrodon lividus]|nr:hypothetical protein BS17DRAFT_763816 [Gyrodon lividus]
MACQDVLTLGAQNWSQVGGIEVVGLVLYLDRFFAGSKVLANLLDKMQANVKNLIIYLTAAIMVKMADPKAKISIPVFDAAGRKSSPAIQAYDRGCNCWVLPDIMVEKCTAVGTSHNGLNFKWKNLLNNLVKHQCYIIDYPVGVQPFGPSFNYHKLSIMHMNALVVPYLKHVMGSNFRNGTANPKPKTIKGKEHEHVDILHREFTI